MTESRQHRLARTMREIRDPRERVLAEAIFNRLIGILRAEQIYKHFGKLGEKIQNKSMREMEKTAIIVASRVNSFCKGMEAAGNKLSAEMINSRVKMELERVL